jgi:hypothetical protein
LSNEIEVDWIKHEHPNLFKRTYSNVMGWISHKFLKQYLKWGTTFEWDLKEDIDREDD